MLPADASSLVSLALRHAPQPGFGPSRYAPLWIVRADQTLPRIPSVHRPSLCFIVQGAKIVAVGDEVFRYSRGEYLYSSVDLPITGEVVEATSAKPYLCLALDVDPAVVFELSSTTASEAPARSTRASRAIFVGQSSDAMSSAFLRLLQCLDDDRDLRVLAPSIVREITYRLLEGPYADAVREIGLAGSQTQRIARVIARLKDDFVSPLAADDLARLAGMSTSSFYEHFKRVTTLSPLQYQKQLRLQEARRLLIAQDGDAAEIAYRVGYESPSQFSREYARSFGLPPIADVSRVLGEKPSPRARKRA